MGESINFHLIFCQCFAQVNVTQPPPFHLEQSSLILEINPVLNATEIAVAIVIQHRGNFCRPRIRIVEVPVSRSLLLVTGSGIRGNLLCNRSDLRDFPRI
jgi:hypothetical protein